MSTTISRRQVTAIISRRKSGSTRIELVTDPVDICEALVPDARLNRVIASLRTRPNVVVFPDAVKALRPPFH
jgi:hypothetical protein